MNPHVGDLARPSFEMCLQLGPSGKTTAGNRVRLDIPDTALVFALGASAIRCTGADPEAPVTGKCMQPGVQHDLPTGRIMVQYECLGVVEQNLARHTAKS